jgi:hypothetical protein
MTEIIQKRISYFDKVLGLEYFDGPMDGVGILPDKSAYHFKIVGWDRDHVERVFASAEISGHTAEALWAAFQAVEPPRSPEWYPQSTGVGDTQANVHAAVAAVRAESKRTGITRVLQSQDLIGETTSVAVDAAQSRATQRMVSEDKIVQLESVPALEDFLRRLRT